MPDNTAESWADALFKLADEARADAAQRDTGLALHVTLKDLNAILLSYAGRLVEVDKASLTPASSAPEPGGLDFTSLLMGETFDPTSILERLHKLENPMHVVTPTGATELPEWLAATLRDLDARVSALEQRANFMAVAPSAAYTLEPVLVVDDNPSAWDSIDRARTALRSIVMREHQSRARIRQNILDRVTALARQPDLSTDSAAQAELRQHEARAQELAEIDAIAGIKFDDIAALDDLELARLFDVKKGWPS